MNIEFATCEIETAFEYLQKVYPSKTITKDQVSKLLDLVGRDIIRVQDPYMYGSRIAVVAGTNYSRENTTEINSAIQQLKDNNLL